MRVLYFAWLREKIGVAEEEISLPAEVRTVAGLMAHLAARSAGHGSAFARRELVRCAVDQEFAVPEDSVAGATEIAFFPPVTGG